MVDILKMTLLHHLNVTVNKKIQMYLKVKLDELMKACDEGEKRTKVERTAERQEQFRHNKLLMHQKLLQNK